MNIFSRTASYFYYKYNFDCYKVFTVIIYIILRSVSILVNVSFTLNALNRNFTATSLLSNEHPIFAISPPIIGLSKNIATTNHVESHLKLMRKYSSLYNVTNKCEFDGGVEEAFDRLQYPYSLLYVILICSALSGTLAVCVAVVNIFMLDRSMHNKLVALKSSTKKANKTISRTVVVLSAKKDVLETILLLVDDISMPALFTYYFTLCLGPQGVVCCKCVIANVNCFTEGYYFESLKTVVIFLIARILMTIIVVTKVHILAFFIWTNTGTMFDFIILRVISTIIYWGIFSLFVLTPTLFIFYQYYLVAYNITFFFISYIEAALPIGMALWLIIILYKIFYTILSKFVG